MDHDSDEHLMQQVKQGSRDALAPLVRRYAGPLLTYLQRMVGNRALGEELFQEVFLAVWRKRRTYKVGRVFRSWLFAIATNQGRAHFRRARRADEITPFDDGVLVAANPGPVDTAISTETNQLVAYAVTCLPAQQRSVVVMRIWNELSYGEIAQVIGCREATVRSHMHHGLATLRRQLEPQLNRN